MKVGVAKVDITPKTAIRLSGYAARDNAETHHVFHNLFAKAIAFGNDQQQPSIFITVDLLSIPRRVTELVTNAIKHKANIKSSNISIAATHTHGGPEVGSLFNHLLCLGDYPNTYHFSDSLLGLKELIHLAEYLELLVQKLVDLAIESLNNRRDCIVSWGMGELTFAVNRRTHAGPVLNMMPLMRITDHNGKLQAILINYACHGITLGPDVNEIHGDWMGEAQKLIEQLYPGVLCLISIGCAAELHPIKQGSKEHIIEYSMEIAKQVEQLINAELHPINTPPKIAAKWISLPFEKVPTIPELIKTAKENTIKGYYSRLALERIARGEKLPKKIKYPIQVWNFDDQLLMINLGGEVALDYSTRLQQELHNIPIWINSYSNDVSCYIPSKRLLAEGGYEAVDSMYWYDKPTKFSAKIENKIIKTVLKLIAKKSDLYQKKTTNL